MSQRLSRTLLVVCGLGLVSPACAQEFMPPFPPDMRLSAAGERRGSPVETLESLTGERSELPERPDRDEIETDRDSFTPATVIAPRRRLIVESAYSFIDNRRFKETHSFPELLLRYGLTNRVELRLGWNAEIGGAGNEVTGSEGEGDPFARQGRVEREYTVAYGAKFRVTDQGKWAPRSILIVQGFTPTGGATNASSLVATYAAGWAFANRFQFDTAVRYGLNSEDGRRFGVWAPSAVLRVPLGEKLAAHIEYFGEFTRGKERDAVRHFISPGVRYLVTPDFEIGTRFGWGLNEQSARFFVNAGFGWRF